MTRNITVLSYDQAVARAAARQSRSRDTRAPSEPHVRAAQTRKANKRAPVMAMVAVLRGEG